MSRLKDASLWKTGTGPTTGSATRGYQRQGHHPRVAGLAERHGLVQEHGDITRATVHNWRLRSSPGHGGVGDTVQWGMGRDKREGKKIHVFFYAKTHMCCIAFLFPINERCLTLFLKKQAPSSDDNMIF